MLTAWWTADGEDSRVGPDFSSASVTLTNVNDLWDRIDIEDCGLFYQRPYAYANKPDHVNDGYFYFLNTADDSVTPSGDCWFDTYDQLSYDFASRFRLYPEGVYGIGRDVLPAMLTSGASDQGVVSLFMTTHPSGDLSDWGPFSLMHYQPWAWHGQVPEVIASIVLQLGISQDYIDTDAFDDVYQTTTTRRLNVLVSREWGRPIIETIKEVALHWFDRLHYTMSGKLAMSYRAGSSGVTGLDGVIGKLRWRYADEHLVNHLIWSFGAYSWAGGLRFSNQPPTVWNSGTTEEVDNDEYSYSTSWNDNLARARKGMPGEAGTQQFEYEIERTASITKFGEIYLGELSVEPEGPLVKTLSRTHHRFQYLRFTQMDLVGINALSVELSRHDSIPREVVVVQDWRGLDYDTGHAVEDLSVGGDSVADFTCISKKINFDRLTVESVLLED